jgi:hypothetical protein
MGAECDILTFVDPQDGRWTEAPIESDGDDAAELVSALKARSDSSEQETEEAYDNQIPWTRQSRAASEPFVHSNQGEHAELHK